MPAPVNVVPRAPQYPPEWKPPEQELWSIPKVITDDNTNSQHDNSIRCRQGVVVEIVLDQEWLFQNINENEDDVIEFSLHGQANGIWGKLLPANFVRAKTTVFFLNRTNKDVLYLASFKQNPL